MPVSALKEFPHANQGRPCRLPCRRKRTSSGLDGLLIGVEDLAAVGVELAVDAVDVDTSTPDRLPR